ncbi:MAG: hypothetical protein IH840_18340 [Candidatus Heimdallarchaeota archaeon]|nr:hypothetical protein [Candidatus Heimdallarchaeota archaeon]
MGAWPLNVLLLKLADIHIVHFDGHKRFLESTLKKRVIKLKLSLVAELLEFEDKIPIELKSIRTSGEQGFHGRNKVVISSIGFIRRYKGTDLFLECIERIDEFLLRTRMNKEVSFILAGFPFGAFGKTIIAKSLDLETKLRASRYFSILRYLDDGEINWIVKKSDLVILPYTSFNSQSGIAAKVANFRIPLIHTGISGLKEIPAVKIIKPTLDSLSSAIMDWLTEQLVPINHARKEPF